MHCLGQRSFGQVTGILPKPTSSTSQDKVFRAKAMNVHMTYLNTLFENGSLIKMYNCGHFMH